MWENTKSYTINITNNFYKVKGAVRGQLLFYYHYKSLSSEKTVPRISKTGKDITVFVKASVQGGNINFHIGMRLGYL